MFAQPMSKTCCCWLSSMPVQPSSFVSFQRVCKLITSRSVPKESISSSVVVAYIDAIKGEKWLHAVVRSLRSNESLIRVPSNNSVLTELRKGRVHVERILPPPSTNTIDDRSSSRDTYNDNDNDNNNNNNKVVYGNVMNNTSATVKIAGRYAIHVKRDAYNQYEKSLEEIQSLANSLCEQTGRVNLMTDQVLSLSLYYKKPGLLAESAELDSPLCFSAVVRQRCDNATTLHRLDGPAQGWVLCANDVFTNRILKILRDRGALRVFYRLRVDVNREWQRRLHSLPKTGIVVKEAGVRMQRFQSLVFLEISAHLSIKPPTSSEQPLTMVADASVPGSITSAFRIDLTANRKAEVDGLPWEVHGTLTNGQRHQLRAHLSSVSLPLHKDPIYNMGTKELPSAIPTQSGGVGTTKTFSLKHVSPLGQSDRLDSLSKPPPELLDAMPPPKKSMVFYRNRFSGPLGSYGPYSNTRYTTGMGSVVGESSSLSNVKSKALLSPITFINSMKGWLQEDVSSLLTGLARDGPEAVVSRKSSDFLLQSVGFALKVGDEGPFRIRAGNTIGIVGDEHYHLWDPRDPARTLPTKNISIDGRLKTCVYFD